MTDLVTASVVGRFPLPAGAGSVSIRPDPGIYNDSDVHLLVFPAASNIRLFASIGSIRRSDVKAVRISSGILQFSGSNSANLPAPPAFSSPDFETLFAIPTEGEGGVSFSYDADTNTMTASRDCIGAVKYSSYEAAAYAVAYTPLSRPIGTGISVEFGTVCAFRPPSGIAIHEVQPFNVFDGNVTYELYRVVSSTVSNRDGVFEKPPNFPNDGNYPAEDGKDPIDVTFAAEGRRTHEIGYMDENGRGWAHSFYVSALEPYVGDNSYVITKRTEIATIDRFPRNLQQKAIDFIKSRGLGPR